MAYKAKKTEHAGAKKGRGAYWGRKRDAKLESKKARRAEGIHMVVENLRLDLSANSESQ